MIWLSKVFHNDDAIWRARLLIQNRFEEELSVTIKRTNQYPSIDLVIPLNASKDCSIYIYNVWDQRTPEMKRRADRSLDKKHSASQLDKLRRWDEYRVEDVIFEYYSRCSIPHTVVHPKCDRSLLDWRNWKPNAILDWRDRRLASILLQSRTLESIHDSALVEMNTSGKLQVHVRAIPLNFILNVFNRWLPRPQIGAHPSRWKQTRCQKYIKQLQNSCSKAQRLVFHLYWTIERRCLWRENVSWRYLLNSW